MTAASFPSRPFLSERRLYMKFLGCLARPRTNPRNVHFMISCASVHGSVGHQTTITIIAPSSIPCPIKFGWTSDRTANRKTRSSVPSPLPLEAT